MWVRAGLLRRSACVLLALGALASSCNSRLLRPPVEVTLDGRAQRVTGRLEDAVRLYSVVYRAYFPEKVAVHPRDVVDFQVEFTGEPHVVALGRLVDEAVAAVSALPPDSPRAAAEALPQMRRLPVLLPRRPGPDVPSPDGAAAMPCFQEGDAPPASENGGAPVCPDVEQPAFDGSHSFYSSGWLDEPDRFRVKIAPDAKPGEYAYMCLVHRADMVGKLQVVDPKEKRPAVIEVKRAASDEAKRLATVLRPAGDAAIRATGLPVRAGVPVPGAPGFVADFAPKQVEIDATATVTWRVSGFHAIAFNPPREAGDGLLLRSGGGVRVNPAVWTGTGQPPPPAAQGFPPDGAGEIPVDGGSWNGQGFHSSGFLRGADPAVVVYTLTFTTPGRYAYACLVHPVMRGVVTVTGG